MGNLKQWYEEIEMRKRQSDSDVTEEEMQAGIDLDRPEYLHHRARIPAGRGAYFAN